MGRKPGAGGEGGGEGGGGGVSSSLPDEVGAVAAKGGLLEEARDEFVVPHLVHVLLAEGPFAGEALRRVGTGAGLRGREDVSHGARALFGSPPFSQSAVASPARDASSFAPSGNGDTLPAAGMGAASLPALGLLLTSEPRAGGEAEGGSRPCLLSLPVEEKGGEGRGKEGRAVADRSARTRRGSPSLGQLACLHAPRPRRRERGARLSRR